MFEITDYALPTGVAEQVADEVRFYIQEATCAREEANALRSRLIDADDTIEALKFALAAYGWTAGPSSR